MTPRAAYVEEVRVRALRLMEDRKWQVRDLTRGIDIHYRTATGFLGGEPAYQTYRVAALFAARHHELEAGVDCPHCGLRMRD